MSSAAPTSRDLLSVVRTLAKEAAEPGWILRDYDAWNSGDLIAEVQRLRAQLRQRREPLETADEPTRLSHITQAQENLGVAVQASHMVLHQPDKLDPGHNRTEHGSIERRQIAPWSDKRLAHDPSWDGIEEELAAFTPPPDAEPRIREWSYGERFVQAETLQARYEATVRETRAEAQPQQAMLDLPMSPSDVWPEWIWGWDDPPMAEAGQQDGRSPPLLHQRRWRSASQTSRNETRANQW